MAIKNVKKVGIKSRDGNVNVLDLSKYAQNLDATLTQKGITMLQTTIDDTETKSATPKAVNTVKAIADANATKIRQLETLVGTDGAPGTLFNDVAYKSKENVFTQQQKITIGGKSLALNSDIVQKETSVQEDTLKVGIKDGTGVKAEISLGANGSITRTELPQGDPTDLELATVKYVKDSLVKDASDSQKGVTLLSDATDSNLDAITGKTAATPKAVKSVKDDLDAFKATIVDATEDVKGLVELASDTETTTGTDGTRAVTPKSLKATLDPINQKLTQLEGQFGASNRGQASLAFEDYTQSANQTTMEVGVYYKVPFNNQNQFIKFDKSTGNVSASQGDGVSDTKVDHVVVMVKGDDGTVQNLGQQDVTTDFDLFAKLAGDQTFTGQNTFNNAPKKTTNSADPNLADVDNTALVSKQEVIAHVQSKVSSQVVVTTDDVTEGEMTEGVIYFIVEADPVP